MSLKLTVGLKLEINSNLSAISEDEFLSHVKQREANYGLAVLLNHSDFAGRSIFHYLCRLNWS
eukprot:gene9707-18714_t